MEMEYVHRFDAFKIPTALSHHEEVILPIKEALLQECIHLPFHTIERNKTAHNNLQRTSTPISSKRDQYHSS
jgi:hypothetical protein